MTPFNSIVSLFGTSPVRPLQQHMAKVVELKGVMAVSAVTGRSGFSDRPVARSYKSARERGCGVKIRPP